MTIEGLFAGLTDKQRKNAQKLEKRITALREEKPGASVVTAAAADATVKKYGKTVTERVFGNLGVEVEPPFP